MLVLETTLWCERQSDNEKDTGAGYQAQSDGWPKMRIGDGTETLGDCIDTAGLGGIPHSD